jgi:hypothetical protein
MSTSAIQILDQQKRLLSPVFKGALKKPGTEGFRGEIALKFAAQFADEARPPEIAATQVMFSAADGKMDFIACELDSLGYLEELRTVLADYIKPAGQYFIFAGNLDISKKYSITLDGILFNVLPLDEATVYNELLDLIGLERNDLKKLDTGAKLDKIAEAAVKFKGKFPVISYEQGVKEMGPIKIPENRPV